MDISLTADEALVLLDWLGRHEDSVPADDAERRALWNLTCALEKVVVSPVDHDRGLAEAKERLLG